MENYQLHLRKTVSYYQLLLQRHARRLVLNETLDANIVQEVLECQYDLNSLVPSKHLRQVLKTDVLNRCHYWEQTLIFVRPIINVPFQKHLNNTEELDDNKTRL